MTSSPADLPPALHDLVPLVAAPACVLAAADGQVGSSAGGVTGWFVDDVRLLSRLVLIVDQAPLEVVGADLELTTEHAFTYVVRGLGDDHPDPTVLLERHRRLEPHRLEETVVVSSTAHATVRLNVRLEVATDLLPMAVVRRGGSAGSVSATQVASGLRFEDGDLVVEVGTEGDQAVTVDGRGLSWELLLDPGERVVLGLHAQSPARSLFAPGRPAPWREGSQVVSPDPRLDRLWQRSLRDLDGLLLRDGENRFLAAGVPWFLTLFGRDALWAARLLLPLGTALALSTLRVLAGRQGQRTDDEAEEQPGKILHEVRRPGLPHQLPPLYFGTVDATPLFVCLLADAARWGADREAVRSLLPAARRCLEWVMVQSAESGWLRYRDVTGRGLSNQGWKDSADGVQHADGSLAAPPIALSEVQGYAYEAAIAGADLLAAYDEPPVPGLGEWAADLRARFGPAFWVDSPEGGHVAIALDAVGQPVGSVTSNQGHLLGTGLLDGPASRRVAELLGSPELRSGFGVRTLSTASPGFSRLSYHGGSVWPHDTAIAVRGLAAEGHLGLASSLAADLVRAGEAFGSRLPELYGGDGAREATAPLAYPAACRPQAWSAAAGVSALVAATGLRVDLPRGVLEAAPRTGTALGRYRLEGLSAGTSSLTVAVAPDGATELTVSPEDAPAAP